MGRRYQLVIPRLGLDSRIISIPEQIPHAGKVLRPVEILRQSPASEDLGFSAGHARRPDVPLKGIPAERKTDSPGRRTT
jgi:hypothetical protein